MLFKLFPSFVPNTKNLLIGLLVFGSNVSPVIPVKQFIPLIRHCWTVPGIPVQHVSTDSS